MSPDHRSIHWALDAIKANERSVAAAFGITDLWATLRDMRGRYWAVEGDHLWWWFPDSGQVMGERVIKDNYDQPMLNSQHGFTMAHCEGETDDNRMAFIFDDSLREETRPRD